MGTDCCGCGGGDIDGFFGLLCQARMLDLLHALVAAERPTRFVDLVSEIGINPNTLSVRLKDLVAAGFVTRTEYREMPPRVEYEATKEARALQPVFAALHVWAAAEGARVGPADAAHGKAGDADLFVRPRGR